ncbi:MAG TPA: GNAT family N-acetyltransferase [Polyangiaceae bacterium]
MHASMPTLPVPRLSTVRLLLREPRLDDFEAFAANAADPVAAAGTGSAAVDAREAWRRFHGAAGHWLLQGMGWWVVEERELGAIGMVGVFRRERGPGVEIGWSVYRAHWRNGYASEAAAAALRFAVTDRRAARVIAHIDKGNVASARVATKIGMRLHGDTAFYSDVVHLYVFDAATDTRGALR